MYNCKKLYPEARKAAGERLDSLLKPIGALGELETLVLRLAAIQGKPIPEIGKKCVAVMAADNGVWEEGISPVPQSVTAMMADNMMRGLTGVTVLCREAGADVFVVDLGIKEATVMPGIIRERILPCTGNITKGPAMTRGEALRALDTGRKMAARCASEGYTVVGAGEMGICNTTTSAAVLCALTGVSAQSVTGMGIGLDDDTYRKKISCVEEALQINVPNANDPIDVIAKVGGLDIAAMCGLFIGCAENGIAAVVDGYISIVAALCAVRLAPAVKDFLFLSHASHEIGYMTAAKELGLKPLLMMDMRLGEGSGCPLLFRLMDSGIAILTQMGTFEQGNIDDSTLVDIRKE